MSMKVLRCLGIRKRHMARKSPCFLRFLSSRSGPNVPHFFFSFFHAASLSWFLLVKIPSHGYDIYSYSLYRETENQTVYGQTYDRGGREKRNRFVKKKKKYGSYGASMTRLLRKCTSPFARGNARKDAYLDAYRAQEYIGLLDYSIAYMGDAHSRRIKLNLVAV